HAVASGRSAGTLAGARAWVNHLDRRWRTPEARWGRPLTPYPGEQLTGGRRRDDTLRVLRRTDSRSSESAWEAMAQRISPSRSDRLTIGSAETARRSGVPTWVLLVSPHRTAPLRNSTGRAHTEPSVRRRRSRGWARF